MTIDVGLILGWAGQMRRSDGEMETGSRCTLAEVEGRMTRSSDPRWASGDFGTDWAVAVAETEAEAEAGAGAREEGRWTGRLWVCWDYWICWVLLGVAFLPPGRRKGKRKSQSRE